MTDQGEAGWPITRRGRLWRLAAVVATSVIVWIGARDDGGWFDGPGWVAVDVAAGVVALAATRLRRRHPLAVALVASALTAVSPMAAGPAALAVTSLATHRNVRWIVTTAVVNAAASTGYVLASGRGDIGRLDEVLGIVVPLAAMVGWGLYVGSNRALLGALRQRAERAEADQEARVAEARAKERTLIAREMHDVVAHRISQVSMRAGALAFRDDLSSAQMRTESEVIRDAANDALHDLRSVLHVLRDPTGGESPPRPLPSIDQLDDLVARVSAEGTPVDLDLTVTRDLTGEVGRTIYRIVQEGLTNAAKHAPGSTVAVTVVDAPDGVALTITNPLTASGSAPPGSGLGLVGITERVAVAGGRLHHGARDGRFSVEAWLPCAAPRRDD